MKRNCPKYLVDKKDGKVSKGIYMIYMLLMCNLQVFIATPWVFDIGLVAMISNSKRELQNEQRLVKDKVTMCVGSNSKVDTNTSKVHINNMYIKYTFVHFVILLIRQVFGVVPLLVTIPLH